MIMSLATISVDEQRLVPKCVAQDGRYHSTTTYYLPARFISSDANPRLLSSPRFSPISLDCLFFHFPPRDRSFFLVYRYHLFGPLISEVREVCLDERPLSLGPISLGRLRMDCDYHCVSDPMMQSSYPHHSVTSQATVS